MHPFLVDWVVADHHIRIPTYGVMLAVAFSAAYFESLRRAAKLGLEARHIENLFLLIVFASVLGARGFHVLFEEPAYYWQHPWKVFAVWEGGYTFYGAMLSATVAIFAYTRWRNIPFLRFTDVATPATTLGLFLGRLGCFFAGCCWGRPTDVPWAVTFQHPEAFTRIRNIPVHPTQVYESLGAGMIFLYLLWLFRRRAYEGQIFFHGLIAYGVLRFLVEFFRGDDYRGYVLSGALSTSQLVSLAIVPLAVAGIFLYGRGALKAPGTDRRAAGQ